MLEGNRKVRKVARRLEDTSGFHQLQFSFQPCGEEALIVMAVYLSSSV